MTGDAAQSTLPGTPLASPLFRYGTQLPLPIDFPIRCEFDNFLASEANQLAVRHLRGFNDETPDHARQVLLCGERGVGKTHLLQAVCHESAKIGTRAVWLPMSQVMSQGTDVLKGMETMPLVCLDDIDAIGRNSEWQFALFRLINGARANRNLLLMSSGLVPGEMDFLMLDLSSRLLWGTVYRLHALAEDNLVKAMRTYAQSRHIVLSQQVIRYLIGGFSRDLVTMVGWIDKLGAVSRGKRREITVPLIKELLATETD